MPDSTSDLYNFQVSPMPSTSEGLYWKGSACLPDRWRSPKWWGLLWEKRCWGSPAAELTEPGIAQAGQGGGKALGYQEGSGDWATVPQREGGEGSEVVSSETSV